MSVNEAKLEDVASQLTRNGSALTDADVEPYRRLFPFVEKLTYFNHGSIAPLSVPVREAIERVNESQAMGTLGRSIWRTTVAPARQKIADLIGAQVEEIAFVRNTVEAISTVAAGIRWKPGDNVVCNDLEFPANVYPWWNLKEPFGVETKMVAGHDGRVSVDEIMAAADGHTRLVTVSFVQFSNGFRTDLARLGALCHARGIYLHVDAIQGVGPLTVDVANENIDFLSCGGHKWLLGPIGAGFLYIRRALIPELWACEPGHLGVKQNVTQYRDYRLTFRDTAEKFEGGVHNYAGIAGLSRSLDMFHEVGPTRISARILELTDQLCAGVTMRGYRLLSPRGHGEKSGTVSFVHPSRPTPEIYLQIMDAGIHVTVSEGAIRVAPHFYNTTTEIDRLISVLKGAPVITT